MRSRFGSQAATRVGSQPAIRVRSQIATRVRSHFANGLRPGLAARVVPRLAALCRLRSARVPLAWLLPAVVALAIAACSPALDRDSTTSSLANASGGKAGVAAAPVPTAAPATVAEAARPLLARSA